MTVFQPDDNDPGQNVAEKERCMTNMCSNKDCAGGSVSLSRTGVGLSSAAGLWSRLRATFFSPSCGKRNCQNHKVPPRLLKLLTLLYASSTGVLATPIHRGQSLDTGRTHRFFARDAGDLNQRTWIPIVVICAAAVLLFFLTHPRGRSTLASFASHFRTPNAPVRTELTAEQLAGSINNAGTTNNNSNGNNTNTTTTRPRRARRPRRTPSQISTHSLPAYAKEPGEQELVVLQGAQDMEDAPIHQPLATVINLDEDAEESADGHHRQSRYSPIPESPVQTPLLQDDPSDAQSVQDPPITGRSSGDTGHDSTGTTSLVGVESHDPELQPRGEAPAYFEVVEQGGRGDIASPSRGFIDAGPHNAPINATPATTVEVLPPSSAPPEAAAQQRRSGFRSLLSRMSVTTGTSTHARNNSAASAASSSPSHTHVRGTSGSALSPFRTLSRQRSIISHNSSRVNLTSPSLISLNSISAPLTHTAIRTEFTYPKSGPTPEQIKFISSRESLARFGLPYGPDALAFAASVSRIDLAGAGERPPEFEEVVASGGDGVGASTSANVGQSLASGGERSDEMQEVSLVEERSRVSESIPEAGPSVVGSEPTSVDGLPDEREAVDVLALTGTAPVVTSSGAVGAKGSRSGAEQGEQENLKVDLEVKEGRSKEVQSIQIPAVVETDARDIENATSSTSVPPNSGISASQKATVAPLTTEGQHSQSISLSAPALPHTDPSPQPKSTVEAIDQLPTSTATMAAPASVPSLGRTTKTIVPPPSSYHLPPQAHDASLQRPESRASQMSYVSYASDITYQTAAESLSSRKGRRANLGGDDAEDGHSEDGSESGGGGGGGYSDNDEVGRPLTPTLREESLRGRQHGREGTDATVVPTKQERHFSTMTITHA